MLAHGSDFDALTPSPGGATARPARMRLEPRRRARLCPPYKADPVSSGPAVVTATSVPDAERVGAGRLCCGRRAPPRPAGAPATPSGRPGVVQTRPGLDDSSAKMVGTFGVPFLANRKRTVAFSSRIRAQSEFIGV